MRLPLDAPPERPDVPPPLDTYPPALPDADAADLTPAPPPPAETFWMHAADGYRLGATRFGAAGRVRAHVVVAGAIGVAQRFYRHFARHAAARGRVVWTADYRGIGRSAPTDPRGARGSLRGFRASLLDWGRLDLAAVVRGAAEAAHHDGVPLHVVAHSFGGHALGLLPEPGLVGACYAFGTGAGWHGWMPPGERLRVLALWHLVGPALTSALGYTGWRLLGMGEDLPAGVYRQWKRWCRYPGYWFDDPAAGPAMRAACARVSCPIAAAAALDDPWAPPASRDAFMAGYRGAPVTRVDLDPASLGIGPVGHVGYFRAAARPLWDDALDWLARRTAPGGDG